MSAEQRGPTPAALADDRTRLTNRTLPRSAARSNPHEVPLPVRIERTRLRLRIAALERLVATSETRRQAVIDRYERVLADRDEPTQEAATQASSSLLARLFAF